MKYSDIISTPTLIKIAESHVTLFSKMLDSGSPFIRVEECRDYLSTWKDVLKDPENLSKKAVREVVDALYSGDYDDLIPPDELVSLNSNLRQMGSGCDEADV